MQSDPANVPANVLAIDTTSDILSLAVRAGERPVASLYEPRGKAISRDLFAEIEVLLRSWNCSTCGAEGESDPLQVPLYCHDCMTKPDEGKWVEVTWATEDLEAECEKADGGEEE